MCSAPPTHPRLEFSLPPSSVRLLLDDDHLPLGQGELLLAGGVIGGDHCGQLELLARLVLRKVIMKSCIERLEIVKRL